MKVLVTGGSGLVGDAIRQEQKDPDKKFVFLSRKDGDLRKKESVEKIFNEYKPDIVVHLASRVGGVYDNMNHNYEFLMDNVSINCNIVDACKKYKVKGLINVLSTCIFPDVGVKYPLTSDQLHNGLPHESNIGYAYSKRLLQVASKLCSIKVVNLIPTNLYGRNDNYNIESGHVIPALIHKTYLAKQNNTSLHISGTGEAIRQFLYANDFAKIIVRFIESIDELKEETNCIISPPEDTEISIKELIYKIVKEFKFTGRIIFHDSLSNGQYKKTTTNMELNSIFDNVKFTSLDDGLRETIHFFNKEYNVVRT
jgi:GDP-L-fucose synthase